MTLLTVLAFNEEDSIGETIQAMIAAREKSDLISEILVVNDGSQDGTADIIQQYRGAVTCLAHRRNYGKTAGFSTALDYAKILNHGSIQLLDADMVNLQPEQIVQLTEAYAQESAARMIVSPYKQGSQLCPPHLSGYRVLDTSPFLKKSKEGWLLDSKNILPLWELPCYGLELALTRAFGNSERVVEIPDLRSRERCAQTDPRKMLYELLESGGILEKYGF